MTRNRSKFLRQPKVGGLPKELRDQIREARHRKGWGQRQLGTAIGMPQPHVSAIESGEVVPRFDTLVEMVRVLDLDLLLVPRMLVPAVQSLIRAEQTPNDEERPLYAVSEAESELSGEGSDES